MENLKIQESIDNLVKKLSDFINSIEYSNVDKPDATMFMDSADEILTVDSIRFGKVYFVEDDITFDVEQLNDWELIKLYIIVRYNSFLEDIIELDILLDHLHDDIIDYLNNIDYLNLSSRHSSINIYHYKINKFECIDFIKEGLLYLSSGKTIKINSLDVCYLVQVFEKIDNI